MSLNFEIGSTNVTGGVISLTGATAVAAGKYVAGSAVTAANTFAADSVVSLERTVTNAINGGTGTVFMVVQPS